MNIQELEDLLTVKKIPKQRVNHSIIRFWEHTRSKAIIQYGYNEEKRVVGIKFRETEEIYYYFDVPLTIYQGLFYSNSKGKYIANNIRNVYRSKRQDELTEEDYRTYGHYYPY